MELAETLSPLTSRQHVPFIPSTKHHAPPSLRPSRINDCHYAQQHLSSPSHPVTPLNSTSLHLAYGHLLWHWAWLGFWFMFLDYSLLYKMYDASRLQFLPSICLDASLLSSCSPFPSDWFWHGGFDFWLLCISLVGAGASSDIGGSLYDWRIRLELAWWLRWMYDSHEICGMNEMRLDQKLTCFMPLEVLNIVIK